MRLNILSLVTILSLSTTVFADFPNGLTCRSGDEVILDCGSHDIIFYSRGYEYKSPVDCGKKGLTRNGTGRIGSSTNRAGIGSATGQTAVFIEGIRGMELTQGLGGQEAAMFHLTPPIGLGRHPMKLNNSHGCIHVEPEALRALINCEGATLTIRNSL